MIGARYHPGAGYRRNFYVSPLSSEIDEHHSDESFFIIQDNKFDVKYQYEFKPMVIFF